MKTEQGTIPGVGPVIIIIPTERGDGETLGHTPFITLANQYEVDRRGVFVLGNRSKPTALRYISNEELEGVPALMGKSLAEIRQMLSPQPTP